MQTMMNTSNRAAAVPVIGLLIFVMGCSGEPAYRSPHTDVHVAELSEGADGLPRIASPTNISDRDGYDNQPAFLPDGKGLLYVSGSDDAVDIFLYDLNSGTRRRLTETAEREYSPTPRAGADGFSCVRVETDGQRRLWGFDGDGGAPELLIEWESDVGYHVWIDEQLVALRLQDEARSLVFADAAIGAVERSTALERVGRSLQLVPSANAISFVRTLPDEPWWLEELDLLTREERRVVRARPGREDHAWTPSGAVLMADGSKVFAFRPGQDDDWVEIADFAGEGLTEITRLAVSPRGKRLALVARRPER